MREVIEYPHIVKPQHKAAVGLLSCQGGIYPRYVAILIMYIDGTTGLREYWREHNVYAPEAHVAPVTAEELIAMHKKLKELSDASS